MARVPRRAAREVSAQSDQGRYRLLDDGIVQLGRWRKDDQAGTIKPRERFTGGGGRPTERLYGSLKAVDPSTGETKVRLKLEYPNYSGALATAGNLVFLGHYDGTFSAHDAKTLEELWSFNAGTGINAPAVSYAVNGKQYIAVLVGDRMPRNVIAAAPELKLNATTSMLYVFSLP